MHKQKILLIFVINFLLISNSYALNKQVSEKQILAEGVKAAESYWNSQKTSNEDLFHSVTPHDSMIIVFDWAFVNKTSIKNEDKKISAIKEDLTMFFDSESKSNLSASSDYAERIIEKGYPILGSLLQKGYWDTVVPQKLYLLSGYKLMTFKYIADIKMQSKRGIALQKRTTITLYRMIADNNDSGWKILFIEGLYDLPPLK